MIDLDYLTNNLEEYKKNLQNRQLRVEDFELERVLELCEEKKEFTKSIQELQRQRNLLTGRIEEREKAKEIKTKLQEEETKLRGVEGELKKLWVNLPNIAAPDVPVGKDENDNVLVVVVKEVGEKTKFDFKPKDHVELGEVFGIIDIERAGKVSGTRFAYLKNEAVLIEFALVQLAFNELMKESFVPVVPPVLIKKSITDDLGYWQAGGHQDHYLIPEEREGFYLVGTAEHSLVPMHKDEILDGKELPKRYVGFSTCFRREAGSYGKDTRGIFRVHQFDKVEMVSLVKEEEDDKEHEYLLSLEEKLFGMLEIPYRVVKMCTADLGFPVARKYDIEAWLPGQGRYREVTSTSTTTDFQARRLNIKYREGDKKRYVHILNGTAFAIGRTLIAIIENYQQKDGSILIPKVLQIYVGKDRITGGSN